MPAARSTAKRDGPRIIVDFRARLLIAIERLNFNVYDAGKYLAEPKSQRPPKCDHHSDARQSSPGNLDAGAAEFIELERQYCRRGRYFGNAQSGVLGQQLRRHHPERDGGGGGHDCQLRKKWEPLEARIYALYLYIACSMAIPRTSISSKSVLPRPRCSASTSWLSHLGKPGSPREARGL